MECSANVNDNFFNGATLRQYLVQQQKNWTHAEPG